MLSADAVTGWHPQSRRPLAVLLAALVAAAALIIPVTSTAAHAAVGAWSRTQLHGGTVSSLATSPSDPSLVLSAAGAAGVFRSVDGGLTWRRSSRGLPADTSAGSLRFAPSAPDVVYVGTGSAGVYRSSDAGLSWTRAARGMVDVTVHSVAVDPADPAHVLAAAGAELYRTTDGGAGWTVVRGPFDRRLSPNVVVFAPSDRKIVYAFGDRPWRSDDGGITWRDVAGEPPHVLSATVDPRNPDVVLAGNFGSVWRTADGGATWREALDVGFATVTTLERAPGRPTTVWAGSRFGQLRRSDDAGVTWRDDAAGLPAAESAPPLTVTGTGVLVGTTRMGVYRRSLTGTTWSRRSTGLTGSSVAAVAVSPAGGRTVWAGPDGDGVWRSDDDGVRWQRSGLRGHTVRALAVSPASSSTVWAVTDRGVYRSTDTGSSWSRRVAPASGSTSLSLAPSAPSTVYVTTHEDGVLRSTDNGATWQRFAPPSSGSPWSVAVHPTRPRTLWIGTRRGEVLRSTDGGATWRGTGQLSEQDIVVDVDPRSPSRVYASDGINGIRLSTDGGLTFTLPTSPSRPLDTTDVLVDPTVTGRVWAAAAGFDNVGVHISDDHGRTWRVTTTGMTTRRSLSLAVQRTGRALAGTRGGGVFWYQEP